VAVEKDFDVQNQPILSAIDVPRLEIVRNLTIENNAILDRVQTTSLYAIAGSLKIINNHQLTNLSFPAISAINGPIDVINNPSLQYLSFDDSLNLVEAQHVNIHKTSIRSFNGLRGKISSLGIFDNPKLGRFISHVCKVVENLKSHHPSYGHISILGSSNQISVSFPSLETVEGNIHIANCARFDATYLTKIDGSLDFYNASFTKLEMGELRSIGKNLVINGAFTNSMLVQSFLTLHTLAILFLNNTTNQRLTTIQQRPVSKAKDNRRRLLGR